MQYFYVQVLINFFYYICSSMALFLFISIHHEIFRGFVLLSLSQWNHIAFIPFTYSSTIDLILQTCTFAQHIYLDILCSSIFNITTSIRFQFNPCDRIGTNVLCHYQSFIRLFYLPNYKHFFINDMELYSNNITGEIPLKLGSLTNLVNLDLYMNGIVTETVNLQLQTDF